MDIPRSIYARQPLHLRLRLPLNTTSPCSLSPLPLPQDRLALHPRFLLCTSVPPSTTSASTTSILQRRHFATDRRHHFALMFMFISQLGTSTVLSATPHLHSLSFAFTLRCLRPLPQAVIMPSYLNPLS
ncbi:hypothetical protein CPB83DRAFT_200748 [Crepidotus variabilis]|uniref:Uncharacterized protein n=1 Tax=Crepidotus variabilis TaxID=179855 RepID=A0A9P6JS22_9AGAR|nr:hypothetical protein CPB83DRAFT_200748 [Crepidotus variabilis]